MEQKTPTVAVVMSTYNGEKYLQEQLDSIKDQTQKPDNVFICDDYSSDGTCNLIEQYISKHNLANWHFKKNSENKGFVKNFLDAASISSDDILFFSDQDDIWDKHKIEKMVDAFTAKTDGLAIYCLMDTIDTYGNQIENKVAKFNQIPNNIRIQPVPLAEKLKYARSPGLCLGFKREILDEVKFISSKYDLSHDIPVGTVAAVKGGFYVLNEVLVHHRVHSANASSPDIKLQSSIQGIDKQIKSRQMKLNEMNAILDNYEGLITKTEHKTLVKAIQSTKEIIDNLKRKNAFGLLKSVFLKNNMMNNALAIRNLLSVLRYDLKGK